MTWRLAQFPDTCPAKSNSCEAGVLAFLTFLVQYLGGSFDDKYRIYNRENNSNKYDFIIVGAGAAGCVVANRLSEIKQWKILLLEAGEEQPIVSDLPGMSDLLHGSSIDYSYITQPEPAALHASERTQMAYNGGKVMGGTTSINGMMYVRGSKVDYDYWSKLGNSGWSYDEVLPYFKKSEMQTDPELIAKYPGVHGTKGYLSVGAFPYPDEIGPGFIEAWKEIGFKETDINSGDQLGTAKIQWTTKNGSRAASNSAFIRNIRDKRSNLFIKTNSTVRKLIFDEDNKRTIGVEYEYNNGKTITTKRAYASKEVIVSAGVIESPKIMLLSGIGPAEDLYKLNIKVIKDLKVGHNLHDHVNSYPFTLNFKGSFPRIKTIEKDINFWFDTRRGRLASSRTIEASVYYQTSLETKPGAADIQVLLLKTINGTSKEGLSPNYAPFAYYNQIIAIAVLIHPRSRGVLKLNSTDPVKGHPLIQMNYLSDPLDIKALVEGMKIARRIIKTKALKNYNFTESPLTVKACMNLDIESDEYFECQLKRTMSPGLHAVGTCKMGPKGDKNSVVDSQLKVHGIKGLRVIDASVMTKVTRGNTMTPTIMIAEKGSDMIKAHWKKYLNIYSD